MNNKNYDVIVVGGGIAGITATAYLSKYNIKTVLFEKNEKVGGLIKTFEYKGFKYDGGARAYENSGVIYPMLKQLGIVLENVHNPVSVGIGDNIIEFKDKNSLKDYQDLLSNNYPDNVDEIHEIIKEIEKVIDYMEVIYGIDNPMFSDNFTDKEYVFKQLLPWLMKYTVNIKKAQKLNEPVNEYLLKFTKNQSLIDAITQHFFKGTPTFFALSYFGQYLDYSYPIGGTGVLIDKLSEYIKSKNNEILTENEIVSVNTISKTVTTKDNKEYSYKYLIWAADLRSLYLNAKIDNLKKSEIIKIEKIKSKVLSNKSSDSVLSVFINTDLENEYYRKIIKGHCFYTPDKRGIGTSMMDKRDVFLKDKSENDEFETLKEIVYEYLKLTTYEISIPSLRDASMSPNNKTGVIVSTLIDYSLFNYAKEKGWYDDLKEYCQKCVIDILNESIFEGFKTKVTEATCSTPITIEKVTNGFEGSITGWAFSNNMPVQSELTKIAKAIYTEIPNVYKAGQWSFYPSGIPTCIITGKLAADNIKKKMRK